MSTRLSRFWTGSVDFFQCSPIVVPGLLLLNALIHVRWAVFRNHLRPYMSEMHQVAATLARTGRIASAYRPDNILTTHVGPVAPAPGALVYWLFGVDSHASELILTLISASTVCALLYLLSRLFAALGESPLACRAGIALATLMPIDIEMEARDFRIREGAYSATILAFILLCLVRIDRASNARPSDVGALALLTAFLFLLSPAAALPAYAACGVMTLRNFARPKWPLVAGIAALVLVAVSLPWALRNHAARGEWVWSRGNAGLELAVGTYAGAVDPPRPSVEFSNRLDAIHPYKSDGAYAKMTAAGGEVAYADLLARETWHWAAAHPADAAHIWLRHVREYYLPPYWLWSAYGRHIHLQRGRMYWNAGITATGLAALSWFLLKKRRRYWYIFATVTTAVIPYIVAQPRTRYRYTIFYVLLFVAVAGVCRAATALRPVGRPGAG